MILLGFGLIVINYYQWKTKPRWCFVCLLLQSQIPLELEQLEMAVSWKRFSISPSSSNFFLSAHNFLFPLNFFIGCFNSKLFFFSFECLFSIFKLFSNRFVLPSQWRQLLLPNWLIGSLSKMDQASSIPPCMWGLVMPPQHMGLLMKVFQW